MDGRFGNVILSVEKRFPKGNQCLIIAFEYRAEKLFEDGRKLREQIIKGKKSSKSKRKKTQVSGGLIRPKRNANTSSIYQYLTTKPQKR